MRPFRLCLVFGLMVPCVHAQNAPVPPSVAAYRASLMKLQRQQLSEWRLALQNVNPEQLPVSYARAGR